MPERPDLQYVLPRLQAALVGREICGVEVFKPIVFRSMVPGTPQELLVGRKILGIRRLAHFLDFSLEGLRMAVNPMLAGRFSLLKNGAEKKKGDTAAIFTLAPFGDEGGAFSYRDDKDMGKIYLQDPAGPVPGLEKLGLDALDDKVFTPAAFSKLAKSRKDQAKVFLMDKTAIDALGNAYADEVLFAAGLHPKTMVRKLSDAQVEQLRVAIQTVLREAAAEIEARQPEIDEKVRDFLKVRRKAGTPCPNCGSTIRTCGVHGHDAFFCPRCQPDVSGRGIVDWAKVAGAQGGS